MVFEGLEGRFIDLAGHESADLLVYGPNRCLFAVDLAWQNRAAVKQKARNVQTSERKGKPGKRLVTGTKTNDCVEHVTAPNQFN